MPRLIANARMYSVDPVTTAAWRELLQWIIDRAGVDGEVIEHAAPKPLSGLWARPDLGCAFMCGYPLSRADPSPVVLAAMVPSPVRYGGRAVYWTDLVVRADSGLRSAGDLVGKRIAFTTEESQSGYQGPRRFFADYATSGAALFGKTVGPLMTPRNAVRAVNTGEADVAPLDSYVHDLLRRHDPRSVDALAIIATTPPVPIPPLVAATGTPASAVARMRAALLEVGTASELARVRDDLLLDRFVGAQPGDYRLLERLAREADNLGYRMLA